MIKPTVGRVVWYRPSRCDRETMTIHVDAQPLAAIVAYVWSDTLVNLTVSDHRGSTHSRTSVYLDQGEGRGQSSPYCEWMPYQKGQAARGPLMHVGADGNLHYVDAMPTSPQEAAADAAALDVSALAPKRLQVGAPLTDGFTLTGPAEPIYRACIHPVYERDYKFGVIRCTRCRAETGLIGGVGDPERAY